MEVILLVRHGEMDSLNIPISQSPVNASHNHGSSAKAR